MERNVSDTEKEQLCTEGGGLEGSNPPEILKALQNRAKLNPIVKTVKNCRILDPSTPRFSEKRQ
jgi:hypothetical protein